MCIVWLRTRLSAAEEEQVCGVGFQGPALDFGECGMNDTLVEWYLVDEWDGKCIPCSFGCSVGTRFCWVTSVVDEDMNMTNNLFTLIFLAPKCETWK